ncbi:MAG: septal ring lytic transglycosylase RlpA family protein [Pseudomonadota bacterium]
MRGDQFVEQGHASWYGPGFNGKLTANGEVYDMYKMTAAHKTVKLGTMAIVKNLENGKSCEVRINDRGPYVKGRVIDLSKAAASKIGMLSNGVARVEVIYYTSPPNLATTRYYIQLASFENRNYAEIMKKQIKYDRKDVTIVEEDNLFKIRIGEFKHEGVARRDIRFLKKEGYEAFLVKVE